MGGAPPPDPTDNDVNNLEAVLVGQNNAHGKEWYKAQPQASKAEAEGVSRHGRPLRIRLICDKKGKPVTEDWQTFISVQEAERWTYRRVGLIFPEDPNMVKNFNNGLRKGGGWLAPIFEGEVVKVEAWRRLDKSLTSQTSLFKKAVFEVKDVEPLLDGEVWVEITEEMMKLAAPGGDIATLASWAEEELVQAARWLFFTQFFHQRVKRFGAD